MFHIIVKQSGILFTKRVREADAISVVHRMRTLGVECGYVWVDE